MSDYDAKVRVCAKITQYLLKQTDIDRQVDERDEAVKTNLESSGEVLRDFYSIYDAVKILGLIRYTSNREMRKYE